MARAIGTIARMANIHKAELIVMGTTGASGLKEVMLGSVASGVIQHAQMCGNRCAGCREVWCSKKYSDGG